MSRPHNSNPFSKSDSTKSSHLDSSLQHSLPWPSRTENRSFQYSEHGTINKSGRSLSVSITTTSPQNSLTYAPFPSHSNLPSISQRLSSGSRGHNLVISPPPVSRSQSAVFNDQFPSIYSPPFPNFSQSRLTSPTIPQSISEGVEYNYVPRSVPITRRNSNELTKKGANFYSNMGFQQGYYSAKPSHENYPVQNRKASAPATALTRPFLPFQPFEPHSPLPLQIDTNFLDDDSDLIYNANSSDSRIKDYLDICSHTDKFPILVNSGGKNQLSVTSAALDLAPLSANPSKSKGNISSHQKDNDNHNKPMSQTRSATHFAELYTPTNKIFNDSQIIDSRSMSPPQELANSGICRYFVQGYCSKNSRCLFKHVSRTEYQHLLLRNAESNNSNVISRGAVYPTSPNNVMLATGNSVSSRNNLVVSPTSNSHRSINPRPNPIFIPATTVHSNNSNNGGIVNSTSSPRMPRRYTESDTSFQTSQNQYLSQDFSQYVGKLASLCIDQHGCRFLQKKLEDRKPFQTQVIFQEVEASFVELMTDPFGNYLCQKLMEHGNAAQRLRLVEIAAPRLVPIALNMHGTRAVQKMLEFLVPSNDEPPSPAIFTIIKAIRNHVVELIKDLNGNHVIQKCIYLLSPTFNQFIYDSVSSRVIEVATHRHGCCVLQRCIDNASDNQKRQLAHAITEAAPRLVQDPFGNYVIQYVLDLAIPEYTSLVIKKFMGRICTLSVQKFSSNVIEKCIRNATKFTRRQLIEELLKRDRLDLLIRDSYANYVVQTCLEFAEPDQRAQLVKSIVPLLGSVKGTTYGKRIMGCINRATSEQTDEVSKLPLSSAPKSPTFKASEFPSEAIQSCVQPDQPSAIRA